MQTTQVPLSLLGLDPAQLTAVKIQGAKVLPGLTKHSRSRHAHP